MKSIEQSEGDDRLTPVVGRHHLLGKNTDKFNTTTYYLSIGISYGSANYG